jgi:hypothetical protein
MYKALITKAAAIAVALTLGAAAQAATSFQIVTGDTPFAGSASADVTADQFTIIQQGITGTDGLDEVIFTVIASEGLIFSEIFLQGAGAAGGADLGALDVTYTDPEGNSTTVSLANITSPTGTFSESENVFAPPAFPVGANDEITFRVFERDGQSLATGVTLDLLVLTQNLPPVPLPATGILMLGLMAAGGVAAHRRTRKAAA